LPRNNKFATIRRFLPAASKRVELHAIGLRSFVNRPAFDRLIAVRVPSYRINDTPKSCGTNDGRLDDTLPVGKQLSRLHHGEILNKMTAQETKPCDN
jgi:hypothetical protein